MDIPLPGGEADKVGNRYELIWTVRCMIDIMNERADSMQLEPLGKEGDGAEFWLQKGEMKEYHQIKRQHSKQGNWSLADLERERILTRFVEKIQLSENSYCVFVSIQDAMQLRVLAERAQKAASLEEFKKDFLEAGNLKKSVEDYQKPGKHTGEFKDFCSRGGISDERMAYNALKRITVEPIGERLLTDIVEELLATLVVGNPETIRKVLAVWALEKIHDTIIASDIWEYLGKQGYFPSELGRGTHDFDAAEIQNERYLSKLRDAAIGNEIIARDEVGIILGHLSSSNGKRGVLISGEAGIGKSNVILQVVEVLRDKKWPVLAFRIDRLDLCTHLPDEVGLQLGLRRSPAKVLAAISKNRNCVLVIDQLDTISRASGRHQEFFECVEEIINQAIKYPQIKLMLACRKFDLDNDTRLRQLAGEQGIVDIVPISRFSDEKVKQVISRLGHDANRLNRKQLDLLSVPLHLSLLSEISRDSAIELLDFDTANALFNKFWECKQDATSKHLGDTIDISLQWNSVIDTLCNYMSKNQILYAPDYVIQDHGIIAKAMVSEHILVLDNKKYAFFHEGFFDYSFARRFIAASQDLLSLLLASEQQLFRRAQVRQILLYERDVDLNRYLTDLGALISSEKIRVHIKKVIFTILRVLDNPMKEEWDVIAPFLGKKEQPVSRDVISVLWNSLPWFKLLDQMGLIEKWLTKDDLQSVDIAINLLTFVQKKLPKRIVELVEPHIDASDEWNKRITRLMQFSDIDTDRSFFDFTLKLIDKGVLDKDESFNPINDHFWLRHAKRIAEQNPEWAASFIGHYFNRRLYLSIINGRRNPFDKNSHIITNNIIINNRSSFFRKIAQSAPEEFVAENLWFLLCVISLTAKYDTDPPYYDSIWKSIPYNEELYASDLIITAVEAALSKLAESKPKSFENTAKELTPENFRTIQYLLIRSYSANGEQFAEDAGDYLISNYPTSFEIGPSSSPHWSSRQLLEAISPYCSGKKLSQLEDLILSYYPEYECRKGDDRYRGLAQFILIGGIYPPRRSMAASCRLNELDKKFGGVLVGVNP